MGASSNWGKIKERERIISTIRVFGGKNSREKYGSSLRKDAILAVIFCVIVVGS